MKQEKKMKEVIDKVRCNNCMNIYDEDITVCPKCKTDEYLMQPFMEWAEEDEDIYEKWKLK